MLHNFEALRMLAMFFVKLYVYHIGLSLVAAVISNVILFYVLGRLLNVGNLKKWNFRNSGTPGRRTKRRKSQQIDFQ